jgi:hypothetical protein
VAALTIEVSDQSKKEASDEAWKSDAVYCHQVDDGGD